MRCVADGEQRHAWRMRLMLWGSSTCSIGSCSGNRRCLQLSRRPRRRRARGPWRPRRCKAGRWLHARWRHAWPEPVWRWHVWMGGHAVSWWWHSRIAAHPWRRHHHVRRWHGGRIRCRAWWSTVGSHGGVPPGQGPTRRLLLRMRPRIALFSSLHLCIWILIVRDGAARHHAFWDPCHAKYLPLEVSTPFLRVWHLFNFNPMYLEQVDAHAAHAVQPFVALCALEVLSFLVCDQRGLIREHAIAVETEDRALHCAPICFLPLSSHTAAQQSSN
mmetsp:Transcript_15002/g.45299  ORF Transcript_15002/g.45299 Transcript_15002/m.45299 type:complete len:273 (+) Transcript_15002:2057-2875(+)